MRYRILEPDELMHFGIKGMRWGHRKRYYTDYSNGHGIRRHAENVQNVPRQRSWHSANIQSQQKGVQKISDNKRVNETIKNLSDWMEENQEVINSKGSYSPDVVAYNTLQLARSKALISALKSGRVDPDAAMKIYDSYFDDNKGAYKNDMKKTKDMASRTPSSRQGALYASLEAEGMRSINREIENYYRNNTKKKTISASKKSINGYVVRGSSKKAINGYVMR